MPAGGPAYFPMALPSLQCFSHVGGDQSLEDGTDRKGQSLAAQGLNADSRHSGKRVSGLASKCHSYHLKNSIASQRVLEVVAPQASGLMSNPK